MAEATAAVEAANTSADKQAAMLVELGGIGLVTAVTLSRELFGWRNFRNRKQVGGASGLTPTPFNTGEGERQQGIDKAGNRRVRTLMIEIAWGWLRYQPNSEPAQWFQRQAAKGSRSRRKAIVGMARRLLVALWRYVDQGVIPRGTRMTP